MDFNGTCLAPLPSIGRKSNLFGGDSGRPPNIFQWSRSGRKCVGLGRDVIVLDGFTFPLEFGWLVVREVVDLLCTDRPETLHPVVTGQQASNAFIDFADLVFQMRVVEHPFEQYVTARAGIEL